MLLGAVDRKLGLIEAASRCIADPRSPLLIHGYDDSYCYLPLYVCCGLQLLPGRFESPQAMRLGSLPRYHQRS